MNLVGTENNGSIIISHLSTNKYGKIYSIKCNCGILFNRHTQDIKRGLYGFLCKKCQLDKIYGYMPDIIKSDKFTVIEEVGSNKARRWKCKCVCGNEFISDTYELKNRKYGCKTCKERRYYTNEIPKRFITALKIAAKKRLLDYNVTNEYLWGLYLKQDKKCIYSKLPIKFAEVTTERPTASLDRIDSNLGYIEGNVQWVHKDVNFMKFNLTEDRFLELCYMISNNQGRPKYMVEEDARLII